MRRTIQIEIDAEDVHCGECPLYTYLDCLAFPTRVRPSMGRGAIRCAACHAAEVTPTSEADARADERRKVLEDVATFSRGGSLTFLGDYARGYNQASLETEEWANKQLAALAKRGEGEP